MSDQKTFVVFDIETTGLEVETCGVHCVVIEDATYRSHEIVKAVAVLNKLVAEGCILTGHNVIEFDIPILERWGLKVPSDQVYDTLVVSRAAYPGSSLMGRDHKFLGKNERLRKAFIKGSHGLKAWGLRLGHPKDDYDDDGWEVFSEEMLTYCVQDVATNNELLTLLRNRFPDGAAHLECEVAQICRRMRLTGVGFDIKAGQALAGSLAERRGVIAEQVRHAFPDWIASNGIATPKRTQNRKHEELIDGRSVTVGRMEKGVSYTRPKTVQFNPASGDHIARCFKHHYGWKPKLYTESGKVQVTSDILRDLTYPEAAPLAEYQEIKKIIGYLSEGQGAWLKLEKNGRLHGTVKPTGTVTGRAAHSKPNLGNVPTRSDLGSQCRTLFIASPGKVIVGADASGLQLRLMAHYLARWDEGTFARQCENGDIHEYMRAATGLFTRDRQKTWTYAKFFGAGAGLLGGIVLDDLHDAFKSGLTQAKPPKASAAASLGKLSVAKLGDAIPAFPMLEKALSRCPKMGYLETLDGRRIPVASEHTALAMLLQGGEAVIMKRAMQIASHYIDSWDAEYVLWVHDEFQIECPPEYATQVGEAAVSAIQEAGVYYELRVRLDGAYKVGSSWADTH